jgi:hypothetical protein
VKRQLLLIAAGLVLLGGIVGCDRPTATTTKSDDTPSTQDIGGNGAAAKGSTQKVPEGWIKVTIPEGPFEVVLPGKPKRNPRPRLDDGREHYQYLYEVTPNSGYILGLTAVPNTQQAADLRRRGDAEFHLDLARDDSLEALGASARLLSEKKIRYATYPGREVLQETNLAQYRSRFFWIENRGFVLMVLGTEREVHSAEADAFLDSFKMEFGRGGGSSGDLKVPAAGTWVALLNGKDLTGWKTLPQDRARWEVKDGMLVGSGPLGHLYTERGDYEDFHVLAEARINRDGNSGIYFRAQPKPGFPPGYEAQINSTHRDPVKTGSLHPAFRSGLSRDQLAKIVVENMLVAPGEWFTQEVIAKGNHIIIKINGQTTVDFNDDQNTYTTGHFALQQHHDGSIVEFRKIEIKELSRGD